MARIAAASSPEDLESARVDVLGRKGALAQISKEMGKLAPEQRAVIGKLLNAVKQEIDTALEAKLNHAAEAALEARLDPATFFRASRSHIVNLRDIQSLQPQAEGGLVASLTGGIKVGISRRQSRKLRELMSL